MKSYCLKYRKNTELINPRVSSTSNGRTIVLAKCAICGSKKSRFIENEEAKGLLYNLGVRTPLSTNIGWYFVLNVHAKLYIRMNEIVNKFLLSGDKCIPEMHLKQPGFTYSVCGPFTKNKERIKKFKEMGDTSYTS